MLDHNLTVSRGSYISAEVKMKWCTSAIQGEKGEAGLKGWINNHSALIYLTFTHHVITVEIDDENLFSVVAKNVK